MTALEEYTAYHPDTVKEIMYGWPWRRFEGLFRRHLLRKAREDLRQMRDMRLAAIDANTNYDSKENETARQRRVEGLQKAYEDGVKILYSADAPVAEEAEEDDPLFAPLKRRATQAQEEAAQPLVEQAGLGRQLVEVT